MLGSFIYRELQLAKKYELTLLLIDEEVPPPDLTSATIVRVDYSSQDSLRGALSGHDALISVLGKVALLLQPRLIGAAIAAGVPRIIPSEFGGDLEDPETRTFPTYKAKVVVEDELKLQHQKTGVEYAFIYNGALLDFAMSKVGAMIINPNDRTIPLYDGGGVNFSATTMADVGRAVASSLERWEEVKNRSVRVHSSNVTQNDIVDIARELTAGDGGKEWTIQHVDTEQRSREAAEALAGGSKDPMLFFAFALKGTFGKNSNGCFKKTDNELLGIKQLTRAQLKEVVRKAIYE